MAPPTQADWPIGLALRESLQAYIRHHGCASLPVEALSALMVVRNTVHFGGSLTLGALTVALPGPMPFSASFNSAAQTRLVRRSRERRYLNVRHVPVRMRS